ncbi:hypothetical protein [Litchfieldella xinjiangensis]|uniref:hypothetical protein n=1 Tax=Litchfieldella xinjiangensis TaxID=1166948 RepID=UPI0012E01AFC|nr:hypothetical protein [Halomonas xinjiangensis]
MSEEQSGPDKHESAVVLDIFNDKTTVADVARQPDSTASEVERCFEKAQHSIENVSRPVPRISINSTSPNCATQRRAGRSSSADLAIKK